MRDWGGAGGGDGVQARARRTMRTRGSEEGIAAPPRSSNNPSWMIFYSISEASRHSATNLNLEHYLLCQSATLAACSTPWKLVTLTNFSLTGVVWRFVLSHPLKLSNCVPLLKISVVFWRMSSVDQGTEPETFMCTNILDQTYNTKYVNMVRLLLEANIKKHIFTFTFLSFKTARY